MSAVLVNGLVYEYPGVRALDRVSFHVAPGSVTALVGPNGSGKTTLLRCLAALEFPLSGRVAINGTDTTRAPRQVHRQVGYLSDFFGLYDTLSVSRCLRHAAAARGVPRAEEEGRARAVAARLGIAGRWDDLAGTLSRGLRQRLAIAQAIIHGPRLLLLDEPASGLDPEARVELARLLCHLREEGMTIIVSSHILAELEAYSTHMLVLQQGRVLSHRPVAGEVTEDREETPVPTLRITLAQPHAGLLPLLEGWPGVSRVRGDGGGPVLLGLAGDGWERQRLLRHLVEQGVPVCGFQEERTSMEQVYLAEVAEVREGGV